MYQFYLIPVNLVERILGGQVSSSTLHITIRQLAGYHCTVQIVQFTLYCTCIYET